VDRLGVYLETTAAIAVVQELGQRQGEPLPVT
jgi:hypothetical protein